MSKKEEKEKERRRFNEQEQIRRKQWLSKAMRLINDIDVVVDKGSAAAATTIFFEIIC